MRIAAAAARQGDELTGSTALGDAPHRLLSRRELRDTKPSGRQHAQRAEAAEGRCAQPWKVWGEQRERLGLEWPVRLVPAINRAVKEPCSVMATVQILCVSGRSEELLGWTNRCVGTG